MTSLTLDHHPALGTVLARGGQDDLPRTCAFLSAWIRVLTHPDNYMQPCALEELSVEERRRRYVLLDVRDTSATSVPAAQGSMFTGLDVVVANWVTMFDQPALVETLRRETRTLLILCFRGNCANHVLMMLRLLGINNTQVCVCGVGVREDSASCCFPPRGYERLAACFSTCCGADLGPDGSQSVGCNSSALLRAPFERSGVAAASASGAAGRPASWGAAMPTR